MRIRERASGLRSSQWPTVLCGGMGLWLAAIAVTAITGNDVLLPTDLLAGSFLVPVTAVVWLFERDASSTLTPRRVLVAFLGGGGLSILLAALLENWLVPRGAMRFVAVGLIEEVAKMAALVLVASGLRRFDGRSGLVLGAAVGFGYAALESSGYALNAFNGLMASGGSAGGLRGMLWTEAQRAFFTPALHGLWTAVLGGVLFRAASGTGRMRITLGTGAALVLVVALHAGWDSMDRMAAFVAGGAAPAATGAQQAIVYWSADFTGSLAICLAGMAAFVLVRHVAARPKPSMP